MSSASLAVAVRPHPEATRVVALSATIALNLAALLALTRPLAPQALALVHRIVTVPQVTFIDPPPLVKPPPPIHLKPLPHPPAAPMHVPPRAVTTPPAAAPVIEGSQPAPTTPPSAAADDTDSVAPIEATLAYRTAPLQFPPQALRQHMQGTVLLRVLVDETGRPVQVEIAHGSGYLVLDRSAREQVLAHWRFQPAIVNGHAVRAWASVPVSFVLNNL